MLTLNSSMEETRGYGYKKLIKNHEHKDFFWTSIIYLQIFLLPDFLVFDQHGPGNLPLGPWRTLIEEGACLLLLTHK